MCILMKCYMYNVIPFWSWYSVVVSGCHLTRVYWVYSLLQTIIVFFKSLGNLGMSLYLTNGFDEELVDHSFFSIFLINHSMI